MEKRLAYDTLNLFTAKEAAVKLKCSDKLITRFIREGNLSAIRVGGLYRIRKEDLDDYINSRYLRATKKAGLQSGSNQ